jgi:hypothetical protein
MLRRSFEAESDFGAGRLVFAALMQNRDDHQVGIRKQPLLGFGSRSFGYARELSEMFVESQSAQVIQADSRQPGNLVLGE